MNYFKNIFDRPPENKNGGMVNDGTKRVTCRLVVVQNHITYCLNGIFSPAAFLMHRTNSLTQHLAQTDPNQVCCGAVLTH
eukprot:1337059-Amphidinium_carterae.1